MTTYSTSQITQFLIDSKYEYAATCWSSDHTQERVSWLETSNWFQKYFIDKNVGRYLFRLMECECVAHMNFQ